MKKFFMLIVCMITMLFITSCDATTSNFSARNRVSTSDSREFSSTHGYLNGTIDRTITFENSGKIYVDIKTTEGKLVVEIVNKSTDESIYSGNFTEDMSFTVNVNDPDKYVIKLDAKKHSGSYKFTWDR